MEKTTRRKTSSAFTLIELLVVVAIIAVLASIALPVFTSVQERARITQDLNNLRQLGIATQTYLNDHDDAFFSATVTWTTSLHPKYLPAWKIFQSPFDSRASAESDTLSPISYGLNTNIAGLYRDKIARPSAFILFAPAAAAGTSVNFTGKSADFVKVLRAASTPGGTATGGTQGKRKRINALFSDLHADSMTWTTFIQAPTGASTDDSYFRWDPTGVAGP